MSAFNIYSSSAGSGKTFTLTKEYLKLALGSDKKYYFKNILAITFTNDAANEMKERILSALKAMADLEHFNETSKFWSMFQMIVEETRLPADMIQFRAADVFKAIIQDYSDFSVKTIDSFVNQLVSAFTDDLGLPFNYEIVLDKDAVLLEAVERLIEKAGQEEYQDISEILEDFVLNKAEEGRSWNFLPDELAKFGNNLLNDQYYNAISKLDRLEPRDFKEIRSKVFAFLKWIENEIVSFANTATQIIETNGLSVDDFSRKGSGIGAYFYNLRDNFAEKFFADPNSYQRDAIENNNWYTKAAPLPIKATIDSIADDLRAIFEKIQEVKADNFAKFLLFEQIKPHFYKLSLLSKIKEEFDNVLDEKNQVFISEFNRKILQIVLREPVPFIYERIGERFDHLLIDEFQDTSEMQFFNLLPLIENSLAKNNFNLIVGDAKQSIYRWRGGKMELIVHLFKKDVEKLIENQPIGLTQNLQLLSIQNFLNPVSLNTNYRSTKEIIEFNNDFFTEIRQKHGATYPFLPKVYDETFQQKLPENPHSGGHVQIEFLEKDENDLLMLERVENIVNQALDEGFMQEDIAILSRSNRNSSAIANYLTEKGFSIISRDSLLLKNSGVIKLLISNLKVLNTPDNKLAKYEAAYLYYQHILHQIPDSEANTKIKKAIENPEEVDLAVEVGLHPNLQNNSWGLYDIAENLINRFGLFEKTKEKSYLFRFLDIVLEFSIRQSNHLQDFLKYWEENKEKLSVKSSGNQDAITITTIHRSKGLEYPVVIIPFANWTTEPIRSSTFWVDLEDVNYKELKHQKPDGEVKLKSSPVGYKQDLLKTPVEIQYALEMQSHFMENLNMLYVAFTRPVEKLFVLSQKDRRGKISGIGKFFQEYLEEKGLFNDAQSEYIIMQGIIKERSEKKIEQKEILFIDKIINQDRSDKLRLRRLSDKVFDPETLDKNKDRVHKIRAGLAKIRSKNDIKNALRELEFEGVISQRESEYVRKDIEAITNLPLLKPLFEEGLRVENEKEILTPKGDILCPDKVVFADNQVFIIQFQTNEARESHERQIKTFGKLYREMGFENIKQYLVYLETKEVRLVG